MLLIRVLDSNPEFTGLGAQVTSSPPCISASHGGKPHSWLSTAPGAALSTAVKDNLSLSEVLTALDAPRLALSFLLTCAVLTFIPASFQASVLWSFGESTQDGSDGGVGEEDTD